MLTEKATLLSRDGASKLFYPAAKRVLCMQDRNDLGFSQ